MPKAKSPPETVERLVTPKGLPIIREIHHFIPSGVDSTTGRETPEKLEKYTEWNDVLQQMADTKGKNNANCLEYHLVDGERHLSQCVQLPFHDARNWFEKGMGMYDVSGEVATILAGKKQAERSDLILEKLEQSSKLQTDTLKALIDLVSKVVTKEGA